MWVGTSVISPSGKVHPASYYHHDATCQAICDAERIMAQGDSMVERYPDYRLARHGYIKITHEGGIFRTDYECVTRITQAQYDAIWDMVMALREGRKPDEGVMHPAVLMDALNGLEVG